MPTTFHFELVSPDKVLFNGSAQAVLVPGAEGDFQVLSDHAPVMTSMRPGVVGIDDAQGKHTRVFVRGGFADASKAGLILLAETAIPFEDLNADKLGEEIKNAEEDLADAKDDQKQLAQEKLDRLRELQGRRSRFRPAFGCRHAATVSRPSFRAMISTPRRRFSRGWDFSVTRAASTSTACCRTDLAASSISIVRSKGGCRPGAIRSAFTSTGRMSTARLAPSPERR